MTNAKNVILRCLGKNKKINKYHKYKFCPNCESKNIKYSPQNDNYECQSCGWMWSSYSDNM